MYIIVLIITWYILNFKDLLKLFNYLSPDDEYNIFADPGWILKLTLYANFSYGIVLALVRTLDPVFRSLVFECVYFVPPTQDFLNEAHLNKLLSKTLNLELIYMALKGIDHFANKEFFTSDESEELRLRRYNFERFITPYWGADVRKSNFFTGKQIHKRDALLNLEENN